MNHQRAAQRQMSTCNLYRVFALLCSTSWASLRLRFWQEKLLTSHISRQVQLRLTCRCRIIAVTGGGLTRRTRGYHTRTNVHLLAAVIFMHTVVRRNWRCYGEALLRIWAVVESQIRQGMGGYCLESGLWWRVEFDEDARNRFYQWPEIRNTA